LPLRARASLAVDTVPALDDTQQPPGATPAHNFYLCTGPAGDYSTAATSASGLSPQGQSRPHFRFTPRRDVHPPPPLGVASSRQLSRPPARRPDDRVRGIAIVRLPVRLTIGIAALRSSGIPGARDRLVAVALVRCGCSAKLKAIVPHSSGSRSSAVPAIGFTRWRWSRRGAPGPSSATALHR
jgi:hypothetical protein